jgi:hypothetical protein
MERHKGATSALASAQAKATDLADASVRSQRSQWGAVQYFVSFLFYMLVFGLIAAVLRTRFPLELGLFFFFTNDDLTEWALRKLGIRLVPESFGANFISAFVWVTGASILFARWKGTAPVWLSSLGPANPPSWYVIAGVALGCAVLMAVSAAVVRNLLPRVGIEIAPGSVTWEITRGLIGFAILVLLDLLGHTIGWH